MSSDRLFTRSKLKLIWVNPKPIEIKMDEDPLLTAEPMSREALHEAMKAIARAAGVKKIPSRK